MNFSIVVATGKNGEIGAKGRLLWSIPSDLKHFKEVTTSSKNIKGSGLVIMGRKTFESLPTYPNSLPNRLSLVLTSKAKFFEENEYCEDVIFFESVEETLKAIEDYEKALELNEEYFIIGGGTIYKQFLPLCNKIYLTEVDQEFPEADTYFKYNKGEFEVVEESEEKEENGFKFKFKTLERVYQD